LKLKGERFRDTLRPRRGRKGFRHDPENVSFVHRVQVADVDGDSHRDIVFAEMVRSRTKAGGLLPEPGERFQLQVLSITGSQICRCNQSKKRHRSLRKGVSSSCRDCKKLISS